MSSLRTLLLSPLVLSVFQFIVLVSRQPINEQPECLLHIAHLRRILLFENSPFLVEVSLDQIFGMLANAIANQLEKSPRDGSLHSQHTSTSLVSLSLLSKPFVIYASIFRVRKHRFKRVRGMRQAPYVVCCVERPFQEVPHFTRPTTGLLLDVIQYRTE